LQWFIRSGSLGQHKTNQRLLRMAVNVPGLINHSVHLNMFVWTLEPAHHVITT